ncbi:anti-sigma factor [Streptomyces sp. NRRL F-5727]|uniref:anti-sigma factor n=1 Tax=Streptomyces sp. NRRL F-5727 TaxID=1463871 RepID=UPI0004C944F2|nr:anti-sigma factor [Streptomyces sp. NRRL F-5727]
MNHHSTDIHALAGAYALDALDAAETDAFTRHLQQCEACRHEVAEFHATTARLADATAEEPPAALKQRTLDAVGGVRQLPPRLTGTPTPTGLGDRLRRKALSLGLAASLAAAASFAGLAVWQHQEARQAQQQTRQAQRNLDTVSGVLAAPDAQAAHGKATNGALTTVVTSERQNKAVFTATGLPAPVPGRTYQLWLQHDDTMRPAGFIHQDGTVLVDGDPADATALGLTLEPSEGSPQPTTTPLLLMTIPA